MLDATKASPTVIERDLGITRSTLSGWFRKSPLTDEQKQLLKQNSRDGWAKARAEAVLSHKRQKQNRLNIAQLEPEMALEKLTLSPEVHELALAMLYFAEGAKSNLTSLGNSDPIILRFFIYSLRELYGVTAENIRCDLHLRADQDEDMLKQYWSSELNLPLSCFKYTAFDKRTVGKPSDNHYKGVCVVACGNIAIQRKLVMLYTLFCKRIESLGMGA